MTVRVPRQLTSRTVTTSVRRQTTLPLQFHTPTTPLTSMPAAAPKPKVGRVARWYLPTMAVIAIGMVLNPLFTWSSHSEPLDSANHSTAPAMWSAVEEKAEETIVETLRERERRMMDAFGQRDNLKDLEKAMEVYEVQ